MEPFSVLTVTTSLIQFLDFAGNLVASTYAIYKRKREHSVNDVESLTNDLVGLNNALTKSLSTPDSSSPQTTPRHAELKNLCNECNSLASELLSALEHLGSQAQCDLWSSFRQALRTLWSQPQIENLQKRLDSFRQQISMHLLEELDAVQKKNGLAQADRVHFQEHTRSVLQRSEELSRNILLKVDRNHTMHAGLIDAIRRTHDSHRMEFADNENEALANTMLKYLTTLDETRLSRTLLHRLHFAEIQDRSDAIPEAYQETYQWIFHPSCSSEYSSCFTDWLKDDEQQLYWITGKPGAGKSTLMKFIFENPQTELSVQEWAQGKELVKASFYFWNSGKPIQMSLEGLARTLLHTVLQRLPHLLPRIYPHLLEAWMIFGPSDGAIEDWSWPELHRSLQRLIRALSTRVKTIFFIDGLDEFSGNPIDVINLVRTLLAPNIKICISSRPWVDFEDAFKHRPSLTIENLTTGDIEHYVRSRFHENPGFPALSATNPEYAAQLIENVALKSSGVFLWVHLVTASLLQGLTEGERLSDLQRHLDSLPGDLEDLFTNILDSLDGFHLARASQIFQIIRAALTRLTVLELAFADEEDPEAALKMPTAPLESESTAGRVESMRRRLNACCRGLVEPNSQSKPILASAPISFLHRTVNDWLNQDHNWAKICTAAGGSFDPNPRLCNTHIMKLKASSLDDLTSQFVWDQTTFSIEYAVRTWPSGSDLQFQLFDEIDKTTSLLAAAPRSDGHNFVEAECRTRLIGNSYWASLPNRIHRPPSFLGIATGLQLGPYVQRHLAVIQVSAVDATKLLDIAVTCYWARFSVDAKLESLSGRPVDEAMIEAFLKLGADPNARFVKQREVGLDKRTIWQTLVDQNPSTHLIQIFLDRGATVDDIDLGKIAHYSRLVPAFSQKKTSLLEAKTKSSWWKWKRKQPVQDHLDLTVQRPKHNKPSRI
ncbi:hypothetical protein LTR84_003877 [Exophiala bonariae]|uniref:NACHT domain-containing protein n=1 Tax=Exophiala bonariae TaxID=1690606 RepID=A0AAV9N993_9EURO|nr:hypothetical protein LTR84_003877 [Exophiala bonariae]